jgi:hypothetical protein
VEIMPGVPLGPSDHPNRNVTSEKGRGGNSRGTIYDLSRGGNIKPSRERENKEIISYIKCNIIYYVYVLLCRPKYMDR